MNDLPEYFLSHAQTTLSDGTVLVCEWAVTRYNPATDRWTPTEAVPTLRTRHAQTLLADGRVLLCGGHTLWEVLSSAEAYDPATSQWEPLPPMLTPRQHHTVSTLHDGRVLVCGGWGTADAMDKCELYSPRRNTWEPAAPLPLPLCGHSQSTLANGRVLVCGGYSHPADAATPNPNARAFLYDPRADTWAAIAPLPRPRYCHAQSVLPSGHVLVTGGWLAHTGGPTEESPVHTSSTEVYDPCSDEWIPGPELQPEEGIHSHSQSTLTDGSVLLCGGEATGTQSKTKRLSCVQLFRPLFWTVRTHPRCPAPQRVWALVLMLVEYRLRGTKLQLPLELWLAIMEQVPMWQLPLNITN